MSNWWRIPKIWNGSRCFIIGGGPSLKEMDLSLIHNERIIGINNACELGDWVDVLYFGDNVWFDDNLDVIEKFKGLKVTVVEQCLDKSGQKRGVKVVRRGPRGGFIMAPDVISNGPNSGYGAINLAAHFGVSEGFLIAFDGKTVNGKHNWHTKHRRNETGSIPETIYETEYNKWLKTYAAPALQSLGIKFWNVTPNSAIDAFPTARLEDVV